MNDNGDRGVSHPPVRPPPPPIRDDALAFYSYGPLACSVCVPAAWAQQQVEDRANHEDPQMGSLVWAMTATTFASGEPNPTPCNDDSARRHWTLTV